MENASKALIMAGAVLLGLLIMAALIYLFNQPGGMYSAIASKEEAKTLAEFNKQYETFNKKKLYGVDIISVINKAYDNNVRTEDEPYLKVIVEVTLKEDFEKINLRRESTPTDFMNALANAVALESKYGFERLDYLCSLPVEQSKVYPNSACLNTVQLYLGEPSRPQVITDVAKYSEYKEFKTKQFKCNYIGYNAETGRVEHLKFEQTK